MATSLFWPPAEPARRSVVPVADRDLKNFESSVSLSIRCDMSCNPLCDMMRLRILVVAVCCGCGWCGFVWNFLG